MADKNLPEEVQEHLGIREVSYLGGRLNLHWLVETRGEECVLRRWTPQPTESIEFERRFLSNLKRMGWPVAPQEAPVEFDGQLWSLSPVLPGSPPTEKHEFDPRARGRLLAEFHLATSQIKDLGQRPDWRRCEDILSDPEIDRTLSKFESEHGETVHILRWHLDKARRGIDGIGLEKREAIPVHGDFAPWNLHFEGEKLTGILDFELSRLDHRVGDFALSWRGKYDEVIRGYLEVSPWEPEEWAAFVPVWWAELIEGMCRNLRDGRDDGGWRIGKLLTRSPIMPP